jgi:hypothetical protein
MAKHLWIPWKKQIDQLMEAGGCRLRVPGDTAHHLADILDVRQTFRAFFRIYHSRACHAAAISRPELPGAV